MQADLLEAIVKRLAGDHDLLENEEFMEWHFRKLNQLDGLNREAIRIIAKRTGVAEKALIEALRRAASRRSRTMRISCGMRMTGARRSRHPLRRKSIRQSLTSSTPTSGRPGRRQTWSTHRCWTGWARHTGMW